MGKWVARETSKTLIQADYIYIFRKARLNSELRRL